MNNQEDEKDLEFCNQYYEFYQFLGAHFPVAVLGGPFNDRDVVIDYAKRVTKTTISKVIEEGNEVLSLSPFPWEIITDLTQLYFETSEEAKEWLKEILEILKSTQATE